MKMTKTKLLKIMHKHCLDCRGGSSKEVRQCTNTECNLWKYRLGKIEENKAEEIVDLVE